MSKTFLCARWTFEWLLRPSHVPYELQSVQTAQCAHYLSTNKMKLIMIWQEFKRGHYCMPRNSFKWNRCSNHWPGQKGSGNCQMHIFFVIFWLYMWYRCSLSCGTTCLIIDLWWMKMMCVVFHSPDIVPFIFNFQVLPFSPQNGWCRAIAAATCKKGAGFRSFNHAIICEILQQD